MKKYLFILTKAAHTGNYLQETLDVILTTAAFDQVVGILLMDDAVFNLKKNQHSSDATFKDTSAIFHSLALYDVNDIYVETESVQLYGLEQTDFSLKTKLINRVDIKALIQQFDVIYSS